MADRVSARITIGGVLPRSLLDELTRLIGDEDLRLDWDGEPFARDAIPDDGPVELMAHEVAWGYFERLERFCENHTLAYVRWSGGCAGSFGPERVVFTGADSLVSYAVTDGDDVWSGLRGVFVDPAFPILGVDLEGGNTIHDPTRCDVHVFGTTDFARL